MGGVELHAWAPGYKRMVQSKLAREGTIRRKLDKTEVPHCRTRRSTHHVGPGRQCRLELSIESVLAIRMRRSRLACIDRERTSTI